MRAAWTSSHLVSGSQTPSVRIRCSRSRSSRGGAALSHIFRHLCTSRANASMVVVLVVPLLVCRVYCYPSGDSSSLQGRAAEV